jgi:hypothetical protein
MDVESERLIFCVHDSSQIAVEGLCYQGLQVSWLSVNLPDQPWAPLDLTDSKDLAKLQDLISEEYAKFEAPSTLSEELRRHVITNFYDRILTVAELRDCGFSELKRLG